MCEKHTFVCVLPYAYLPFNEQLLGAVDCNLFMHHIFVNFISLYIGVFLFTETICMEKIFILRNFS